jgi:hypothetical protein
MNPSNVLLDQPWSAEGKVGLINMFHTTKVVLIKDIELTAQVLFLCAGCFQLQAKLHPHYPLFRQQSVKKHYNLEMLFSAQALMLFSLQDGLIHHTL